MLSSFQVKNFRLFKDLRIKNIRRVNLIVGKNNSGKSSFLESLALYTSDASPEVIFKLLESRQEDRIIEQLSRTGGNPIRHLFFDHRFPDVSDDGICLGEIESSRTMCLKLAVFSYEKDSEGNRIRSRILEVDEVHEKLLESEVFLVMEREGKVEPMFNLKRDIQSVRDVRKIEVIDRRRYEDIMYGRPKSPLQIVLSNNTLFPTHISDLWDLTSATELRTDVIGAMRLIDDRLLSISFTGGIEYGSKDYRIPIIGLRGFDELFPLRMMGDGVTRFLSIVLALVNAKNGCLLIDEFENGLHWKVQPKIWDFIFQFAEKLNVQVFATTHSRDCVQAFESTWRNHPNCGAFLRLDRKRGDIRAVEYTPEILSNSIEMDVEVR